MRAPWDKAPGGVADDIGGGRRWTQGIRSPAGLARQAALGARTTLGVGGPAAWEATAPSPRAMAAALAWARARGLPTLVVGSGSNLLVGDAGFDGLVVRSVDRRLGWRRPGWAAGEALLVAGAGVPWEEVVAAAAAAGRWGIERLAGIPGSVGAAPVQNIGAYGQELADVLRAVWVLRPGARRPHRLAAAACQFAYRSSRFKATPKRGEVVVAVALALGSQPATPRSTWPAWASACASPGEVARATIAVRQAKGMVWAAGDPRALRSAGSFFLNPVVDPARAAAVARRARAPVPQWPTAGGIKLSAAWLIEQAGLPRALVDGRVGLSPLHALALINLGGARADDVVALAGRVRAQVWGRFAVDLRAEVRPVGLGPGALTALGLAGDAAR